MKTAWKPRLGGLIEEDHEGWFCTQQHIQVEPIYQTDFVLFAAYTLSTFL